MDSLRTSLPSPLAASGTHQPGGGVSIDEEALRLRARLERRDHDMTCEEWGGFLVFHFPAEYYDVLEPPEPTRFLPGSPAKIDEMSERASAGQSPFHPKDKLYAKKKTKRIAKHLANGEDDLDTYETEAEDWVQKAMREGTC